MCTHARAQRGTLASSKLQRTYAVLSHSLQCPPLWVGSPDTFHYGDQSTASTTVLLPQPRHCGLLLFSRFPLQVSSQQQLQGGAIELTYVKVWMSHSTSVGCVYKWSSSVRIKYIAQPVPCDSGSVGLLEWVGAGVCLSNRQLRRC